MGFHNAPAAPLGIFGKYKCLTECARVVAAVGVRAANEWLCVCVRSLSAIDIYPVE